MDQPGKVANPARGQLNRENNIPLSPCVPENFVSRDGFSRPVPRQSAHLHTQAESGAYLRIPPEFVRIQSFDQSINNLTNHYYCSHQVRSFILASVAESVGT